VPKLRFAIASAVISKDPIIKTISYNLRKNAASSELTALVESYDPDVLCLQEADASLLPEQIGHLKMADATRGNRLGLAIYYRLERFTDHETRTFVLKKGLHDRIAAPTHERLIASRMFDNERQREIIVASFHAAPLTALNSLRRNQIKASHDAIHALGEGLPALMVGDYNYPLFQTALRNRIEQNGYDLSLSDRRTYTRYKIFRGHFDFATSSGMTIERVETLPKGLSDHLPIMVTASLKELAAAA
jgi:endonuclease/exonuclease/phosphatase (EEP) superfamily protein YafD